MRLFKKVGKFTIRTMLKRKLSKNSGITENPRKFHRSDNNEIENVSVASDNIAQKFVNIQLELNSALQPLEFNVDYIYNPVKYAFKPYEKYVNKYCQSTKKLLFVGMNPGPFGMCQTGVPFGEVNAVKCWLGIEEEVGKPEKECPQRPVLGFQCPRSEESGKRLWNLLKKVCGTPDIFFQNCFVYNYCPIAFLKSNGGNLTPSDIKDTKILEEICDSYFFKAIQLLQPEIIIGIGRYAEKRALLTLKQNNCNNVKVIFLTHPSPRVKNNQNWAEKAEGFFKENDLLKYMTAENGGDAVDRD